MIECSYVKADCSSETHFEIKGLSLFVRVFENNLIENIKKVNNNLETDTNKVPIYTSLYSYVRS